MTISEDNNILKLSETLKQRIGFVTSKEWKLTNTEQKLVEKVVETLLVLNTQDRELYLLKPYIEYIKAAIEDFKHFNHVIFGGINPNPGEAFVSLPTTYYFLGSVYNTGWNAQYTTYIGQTDPGMREKRHLIPSESGTFTMSNTEKQKISFLLCGWCAEAGNYLNQEYYDPDTKFPFYPLVDAFYIDKSGLTYKNWISCHTVHQNGEYAIFMMDVPVYFRHGDKLDIDVRFLTQGGATRTGWFEPIGLLICEYNAYSLLVPP
mgnify:CR=1 FL=1